MAQVLISEALNVLLDVIGAAAWDGVRGVESDFGATTDDFDPGANVALSRPPSGELCDSVNVWIEGFLPTQDIDNCSLVWSADVRVRLDMCAGFEDPDTPLRTAEERIELTDRFLPLLWGMMAGLTRAWRDGELPGPLVQHCQRVEWGTVAPAEDEGGFVIAEVQIRIQISPEYEEVGS